MHLFISGKLNQSSSYSFVYKVISITLLYLWPFLIGCTPETKDTGIEQPPITPSSKDSLNTGNYPESLLELKRKIAAKRKNPILYTAQCNKFFKSEKWLKGDRDFYKRLNPRRISEYDPIIKKMARRYGFDWRLIAAQIYTESNFKTESKSYVGAMGLMQIMPGTAKFMGFDPKTMTNPEMNIAVGCMYDQRMYNLWRKQTKDYNRLAFALASYNAGRGRVLKSYSAKRNLTKWEKVHPLLPEETQLYVHKIYLKHDFYKKHILP